MKIDINLYELVNNNIIPIHVTNDYEDKMHLL